MIIPNLEEQNNYNYNLSSKVAKINKKTRGQCDGSPSQHQLSWCFHLPFWSDGQIALTPSPYSRHDLLKQIPQEPGNGEFPNLILRFLYCYFIQLVVLFASVFVLSNLVLVPVLHGSIYCTWTCCVLTIAPVLDGYAIAMSLI